MSKRVLGIAMAMTMAIVMLIILVGAGMALAIPLCNYTPAESRYASLTASLNFRYFDDQYRDNRNNASSGTLTLNYTSLFDSADSGYDSRVDTKVSYNNGEIAYSGVGSGSYRMYLAQGKLFAFGSATLHLSSDYTSPGLNVVSGTGYGRFRDVTPLAKAIKISETLLEMGSLSAGLDDETLLAIAQEIGKRAEYPDLKELVRKVVELINATGLVTTETGELGPVEALRIEEIIKAVGDLRLCGWDARAGIGYEVLNPHGAPREFLQFAGINYAIAPDIHSQFLAKLDFTSQLMGFASYTLAISANYAYRINPELTFAAGHTFLRTKPVGEEPRDVQVIDFKGIYTSRANWTLTAELTFRWETGFEEWTKEFTATVDYTIF